MNSEKANLIANALSEEAHKRERNGQQLRATQYRAYAEELSVLAAALEVYERGIAKVNQNRSTPS